MTQAVAPGSLDGRVALVTGGATGIGRAIVERLARDGAAVVAVSRDESRGRELTEPLQAAALDVAFVRADVSVAADCRQAVDHVIERHGRLDIVVNNAAMLLVASVEETTDEAWDEVLRTNLTSVFAVSKAAIPHLRAAGGGSIVNIASVHAQATVERLAAYAATKGAVVALSRQMAHDLALDRIRVNAVVVGGVATAMSRRHGEALGLSELSGGFREDDLALGRTARPDEIAGAVRFLVGPDASFVNGSALVVDGGMLAKLALD
jgi:NAD(P)-dependent dehydrogenase (short-subunit alcohol dehydrogenase family)